MDAAWRDQVQKIFVQAAKLPAVERAAFLRHACRDDEQRREVESRLAQEPGVEGHAPPAGADAVTAEVIDVRPDAVVRKPAGEIIADRYEVIGKLGAGGMGQVVKVRDQKVSGRLVALKRILHLDDQACERFQREIDAAAHLNHRNICKIYECGEDEQGPYFTMELLAGGSLSDRVKKHGPLSGQDFVGLARQLAQALRYAHRKGIQHRDIKPSNVLFAEDGDPKLADFGLARIGPSSDLSISNHGLGTMEYSAHEQLRNSKSADHRADIYSLGATLYFALTGKPPVTMLDQSAIPQPWRPMILKCMAEDPSDRYFDAGEILVYLEKTPTTSSTTVTDKCSQCSAPNPSGFSFCHQCGAGLNEPCPNCRAQNRAGETMCHNCRIDIPKRRASDKLLQEALAYMDKGECRRAARAASEALRLEPGREEAKAILADAQGILQQRASLRDSAEELQLAKKYREAIDACKQLLQLDPDEAWADEKIKEIQGQILDDRFHEQAKTVQSAVDDRSLAGATSRLQELCAIDAPAAGKYVPQAKESVERLRRELILQQREALDAALAGCDWKAARTAIGRLSELQVNETEVTALLARLKVAQRSSRRWRVARRLVASAAVLMILAAGYLVVAGVHNAKIAGRAAAALADGRDLDLGSTRILPGWPWNLGAALADRSGLCVSLDQRYESGEWRTELDQELFHVSASDEELITAYDWFVLRQCVGDAGPGSDAALEAARNTLRKLELDALGGRAGSFKQRQESVGQVLVTWYSGLLNLGPFADPTIRDPKSAFVANLETQIRNPLTGCLTIRTLSNVIGGLGWGGSVEGSVRVHDERVLARIDAAVRDSSGFADLLDHICDAGNDDIKTRVKILETVSDKLDEPPNVDEILSLGTTLDDACDGLVRELETRGVAHQDERADILAVLVELGWSAPRHQPRMDDAIRRIIEEGNKQLFSDIEQGFESGSEATVADALARLDALSAYWSYLKTEQLLNDLRTKLRLVDDNWVAGTRLASIGPLCRFNGADKITELWARFLADTQSLAVEMLDEVADARRVAPFVLLLLQLGHGSDTLDELSTRVVESAIETRAYGVGRQVAELGTSPRLQQLVGIAADLERLDELDKGELRALRNRWPDGLVAAGREVDQEVTRRLAACLPAAGTTLTYPGRFEIHTASYFVEAVVGTLDREDAALSPLPKSADVYGVPYQRARNIRISVTADGIKVDRDFPLELTVLAEFGDVTFREGRVVEGEPAILVIGRAPGLVLVEVDGRQYGLDDLVENDDHRTLALATALDPYLPTDERTWAIRLVARSGIEDSWPSIRIDSTAFSDAKKAFELQRYGDGFDALGDFARRDHDEVNQAVLGARDAWYAQLEASRPRDRREADGVVSECDRFAEHDPLDTHPGVAAIRDSVWLEGIELTTTWNTVADLQEDLAHLKALKADMDVPQAPIDWLEGVREWARPIVDHMARMPGDWDLDSSGYPALLVHRQTGLEFVYVRGGTFRLGGGSTDPQERTDLDVTVSGFYLSKTEVTNDAWMRGSEGTSLPSANGPFPKTVVDFEAAREWSLGMGLDLPTETQWELAAGGSDSLDYPWGKGKCAANFKARDSAMAEVASYPCDRSQWCGAMDMAGNVREWCRPVINKRNDLLLGLQDPEWMADAVITRGGSYRDNRIEGTTHRRKDRYDVATPDITIGFRPVVASNR